MRLTLPPRTDELHLPQAITRLVVLGDPHGDLAGLDAVLARETQPGTAFVSVGDNVGYSDGPTSSAFCRRLQELKIPSVFGNHEAWLDRDGNLAILAERAAARQLTPEALAWCAGLPLRLRVTLEAAPDVRATVVHTLVEDDAHPSWDFISTANAKLVADVERVELVLVGHTHGAAVHALAPGAPGAPARTSRLALEPDATVSVPLERGSRYVVDAGSLGRPGHHPDPGRFDLATYAAVNVATRSVSLHALQKG